MTIRAEQLQIFWLIIVPFSVNVMNFYWNLVCNYVPFTPAAFLTSFAARFN